MVYLILLAIILSGLLVLGIVDTSLLVFLLPFITIAFAVGLTSIIVLKLLFFKSNAIPTWLNILIIVICLGIGLGAGIYTYNKNNTNRYNKDTLEVSDEVIPVSPVITIYENLKENSADKNGDGVIDNLDVIIDVNERKDSLNGVGDEKYISNDTFFNMNIMEYNDMVVFYYVDTDKNGNTIYPNLLFQKTNKGLVVEGVLGASISLDENRNSGSYYYDEIGGALALNFNLTESFNTNTLMSGDMFSIYRSPSLYALAGIANPNAGPITKWISSLLLKDNYDRIMYGLRYQFFRYFSDYFIQFDNLNMMFKYDTIDVIYSIDKLGEICSFYTDLYEATAGNSCTVDVTTRTVKLVRDDAGNLLYGEDGCVLVYKCKSYFNMNYKYSSLDLYHIYNLKTIMGEPYELDENYLNNVKIDGQSLCFQVDNSVIEKQDTLVPVRFHLQRWYETVPFTTVKTVEYDTPSVEIDIDLLFPFEENVKYSFEYYVNGDLYGSGVIEPYPNTYVISNIREEIDFYLYEILVDVPVIEEYSELWYTKYKLVNPNSTNEDVLNYVIKTFGVTSSEYSSFKLYLKALEIDKEYVTNWQAENPQYFNEGV